MLMAKWASSLIWITSPLVFGQPSRGAVRESDDLRYLECGVILYRAGFLSCLLLVCLSLLFTTVAITGLTARVATRVNGMYIMVFGPCDTHCTYGI